MYYGFHQLTSDDDNDHLRHHHHGNDDENPCRPGLVLAHCSRSSLFPCTGTEILACWPPAAPSSSNSAFLSFAGAPSRLECRDFVLLLFGQSPWTWPPVLLHDVLQPALCPPSRYLRQPHQIFQVWLLMNNHIAHSPSPVPVPVRVRLLPTTLTGCTNVPPGSLMSHGLVCFSLSLLSPSYIFSIPCTHPPWHPSSSSA